MIVRTKSVSLCMIVKNEERYLSKCLESVQGLVDEIILIDTGSTDDTLSIAEKFLSKVFTYEWNNSFSDARNFSIEKASSDWILLLDADEVFERDDADLFIEFINHSAKHGCHFNIINYIGKTAGKQYSMHNAFRLLRNNGLYHFGGSIHEQIQRKDGGEVTPGTFGLENIRLHHYGYLDDVIAEKSKHKRNLPLLFKELEKDPKNAFALFNLGNEYLATPDYGKALEQYDKAYALVDLAQAYAPHLIYRRAMVLQKLKRYEASSRAALQGVTAYPTCTDLMYLLGMVYFDWGRYTLAIQCFNRCLEMGEPPSTLKFIEGCATSKPLLMLGEMSRRFCDYEKAIEYFKKAVAADNNLYTALYAIGDMHNKLNEDKEAVVKSIAANFSNLDYVPNLIILTDILIRLQIYSYAAGYVERMEKIGGYETDVQFLRGKLHFYRKEYIEAETTFDKLLESVRNEVNILQNIPGESTEYLFLISLLIQPARAEERLLQLRAICSDDAPDLYTLLWHTFSGQNSEPASKERTDDLLRALRRPLDILLKVREFDLFEKLLLVYNLIDSKAVLIHLGSIYLQNNLKEMATQQVYRSVKELDYFDSEGLDILNQAKCL